MQKLKTNACVPYVLPKLVFLSCLIIIFSSCVFKHVAKEDVSVRANAVPLFIQMPTSSQVFENIAPIIYDSFVEHFELVGYKVVSRQSGAYKLSIAIKNLDPVQKYVSPDILLFNSTIKLELVCELLNFNGDVVVSRSFNLFHLIPKPKNPVVNSDFLDFEYRRLMKNSLPKIEHVFRPYLIGKR